MSNIQVYQRSSELERITKAKESIKIKHSDTNELKGIVFESFTHAVKISGDAIAPEALGSHIQLVYELVMNDYSYLGAHELKIISEKGAYGAFGQNFGINPKTFKQWIDAYLQSHEVRKAKEIIEERERQKQKIKRLVDCANPDEYYDYLCSQGYQRELTWDERDFKISYSLKKEFERHKVGDIVADPQNIYYNFMVDVKDLVSFSKEEKDEAYSQVVAGNIIIKANNKIDEQLNKLYKLNIHPNMYLAKCYLLSKYFDTCKIENKNPF